MRAIKFRGRPVEDYGDVRWFFGSLISSNDDKLAYIEADYQGTVPVEFYSVGQYTGLKDTNGREIYEGDIMEITFDTNYAENPFYVGEVKYGINHDYPAFDLDPWIDWEMNALSWLKSECDPSVIKYEVVGNIYENPELLK